jgi:hypothetical protein
MVHLTVRKSYRTGRELLTISNRFEQGPYDNLDEMIRINDYLEEREKAINDNGRWYHKLAFKLGYWSSTKETAKGMLFGLGLLLRAGLKSAPPTDERLDDTVKFLEK